MSNQTDTSIPTAQLDESRVPSLIATWAVCFVLIYVSAAGRLLARKSGNIKLGLDDWLIVVSLLFSTAFFCVNCLLTAHGLGRHQIFVTDPRLFVLSFTIAELLYTVAVALVKMSLLVLLHRLFPGRQMNTTLYIIGAVIFAYSVTQFVCVILQCIPLSSLWDPSVQGKCIDLPTVFMVCSSFNIVTDVAILSIPIAQLWKLKMSISKKLQLTAVFLLGGFVLVISIIRLPQLREISPVDQSWSLTNSAIWSALEAAVATLSACLPVMRPLLVRIMGRHTEATHNYSQNQASAKGGWVSISHDGTGTLGFGSPVERVSATDDKGSLGATTVSVYGDSIPLKDRQAGV